MADQGREPGSLQEYLLDPVMRSKLGHFLLRFVHSGVAIYVLAAFVLAVAAVLIRQGVAEVVANFRNVREEVEDHLHSQPEVMQAAGSPGVAWVFSALANDPYFLDPSSAAHQSARRMKDAFRALAGSLKTHREEGISQARLLLSSSPNVAPVFDWKDWELRAEADLDRIEAVEKCEAIEPIEICPDLVPDGRFYLGAPGCDRRGMLGHLLVPPSLECGTAEGEARFPPAIQLAVAFSRLFDLVIEPLGPSACAERRWGEGLVAAYFISPYGLMRHWSCDWSWHDPSLHYGTSPLGTSYFRRLSSPNSPPEYTTDVYIDAAGNGMVRTSCARIDRRSREGKPSLWGILCFDATVPLEKLVVPLARSALLDVRIVEITRPDEGGIHLLGYWRVADPRSRERAMALWERWRRGQKRERLPGSLPPLPAELTVQAEEEREELQDQVWRAYEALKGTWGPTGAIRRLESSVVRLDNGSSKRPRYLLPAGWSERDARLFLVVEPKIARLEGATTEIVVGFALLGIWGGLVMWAYATSRRIAENDLVVGLLQKLGFGLALIDERGVFMAANNAASEVLGIYLPRLNRWRLRLGDGLRQRIEPTEPEIFAASIVEPTVLVEQGDGRYLPVGYDELWTERIRGRSATFYARLRPPAMEGRWIRITTAPVILHKRGRRDVVTSFSAFEAVTDRALEKELERLQGGRR